MLTMGSAGLGEPVIEKATAGPANPVQDAIEDALALLILLEAQMEEVVHKTTGLRKAERVHKLDVRRQRIQIAGFVCCPPTEEGGKIASGCKAQPHEACTGCRIFEFIQSALLERCPGASA